MISLINLSEMRTKLPPIENFLWSTKNKLMKDIDIQIQEKWGLKIRQPQQKYYTSIGLLLMGALAKERGFKVNYIDYDLYILNNMNKRFKNKIRKSEIIGITCYTSTYSRMKNLIRNIKIINPNAKIIVGGVHNTYCDEDALKDGANFVVRGEGEKIFCELISKIDSNRDYSKIKGISYINNGKLKRTPDEKVVSLDELPTPAYELLEPEIRNNTIVGLYTSRGCPFNCIFCSEKIFWKKHRYRNIDKVVQDINAYVDIFDSNSILFSDSTFGINKKYTLNLLNRLKQEFSDLYFSCQTRADIMDKKIINYLINSNFIGIFLGIESGSNKILENMRKGETFRQYVNFLKKINGNFPYIYSSWMFGHPGEDYHTIYETLRKLDWLHRNEFIIDSRPRVFIPYPGTPIFETPSKYDVCILTKNWERYSRFSFPPIHRLKTLSELEIWYSFIQAFLIGLKHLFRYTNSNMDLYEILSDMDLPTFKGHHVQYRRII